MELEDSLKRFETQGLGVAAISYDTHEILAHFSSRMGGFHYPLLADPDSSIIEAFGVLNRNIEEGHPFFGMARPGTFVVDANGVVTSKFFEPGHRQRVTADSLLVREFGVGGGTRTEIRTDHLKLTLYPAQDVARRGNRVTLVMELELPEKMHVYAPGVEGYRPVAVELADDPHLRAHETVFPESEVLHLPAIDERVPVYHGEARILQDVTISPRLPGYEESETRPLVISGTFSYQACDDRICYVPTEVPIRFEMELVPHDQDRAPEAIRHRGKTTGN